MATLLIIKHPLSGNMFAVDNHQSTLKNGHDDDDEKKKRMVLESIEVYIMTMMLFSLPQEGFRYERIRLRAGRPRTSVRRRQRRVR